MVIKSQDVNMKYILIIIAEIIIFTLGIWWAGFEGNELKVISISCFLIVCVTVSSWFGNAKTITMDETGCEVCVWKFRKKYTWNELKTKRMEIYHKNKYEILRRGIVFSTKKVRELNYAHPSLYTALIPYLGFFYVTFPIDEEDTTWLTDIVKDEDWYQVNEEEFISKMHEWGVRIENGLPAEKRQKYPGQWI